MNPRPDFPSDRVYALRLQANTADPRSLSGQLEHVLSGRCHEFSAGAQLLACLLQEQARANAGEGDPPRAERPPAGAADGERVGPLLTP